MVNNFFNKKDSISENKNILDLTNEILKTDMKKKAKLFEEHYKKEYDYNIKIKKLKVEQFDELLKLEKDQYIKRKKVLTEQLKEEKRISDEEVALSKKELNAKLESIRMEYRSKPRSPMNNIKNLFINKKRNLKKLENH